MINNNNIPPRDRTAQRTGEEIRMRYMLDNDDIISELYDIILPRILIAAHPVGSVYISDDPTNPEEIFGGRWEQIKGKFIYAVEDGMNVNEEGGEKEHTLSEKEMPRHRHNNYMNNGSGDIQQNYGHTHTDRTTLGLSTSYYYETTYAGGGASHNNMPPFVAKYMWQRVE